jgi:hypothetical protein
MLIDVKAPGRKGSIDKQVSDLRLRAQSEEEYRFLRDLYWMIEVFGYEIRDYVSARREMLTECKSLKSKKQTNFT